MAKILHSTGNQMAHDTCASPVKIILADDHPALRAGFAMTLPRFNIEVVGEAARAGDVIARYKELKPDVLVLDIRFGEEMSGLDVAAALLKTEPTAKVVFLSQFNQDSIIKRAYQIGGRAFLTKDCEVSDLAAAIKKVTAGEVYFMPKVDERLATLSVSVDPNSPMDVLQERELTVFKLMARGLTIVEIAEELQLSVKTISNTSLAVKEKLNLHRPADITLAAVRYGLLESVRL